MTIKDYFKNYRENSVFPYGFSSKDSATINDFFKDFIEPIYQDKTILNNMLAWHEMLVEYGKNDNNIFWVRQYESGGQNSNDNRRASLVEFDDGFKILYVSNFDAQEILNMAIVGVTPNLKEFEDLMNNHEYYFHYSSGCVEKRTNSYPHQLNARSLGVLTQANYYLAHIRSVNDHPYYVNGTLYDTKAKQNKKLHDDLYPKGNVDDYKKYATSSHKVYKAPYKLTNDEKSIIRAHFLRFVDPLNYFPVPGEKNHVYEYNSGSPAYRNIGEFPFLISYMYEKMCSIFSKVNFDVFDKLTCFDKATLVNNVPNMVVNVAVRKPKNYSIKSSTPKSSKKVGGILPGMKAKTKPSKRKIIFELIKEYINRKNVKSFAELNEKFPGISKLTKDIKDPTRFSDEEIHLENGDLIKISNQIGDKEGFDKKRNYSELIKKLSDEGIFLTNKDNLE